MCESRFNEKLGLNAPLNQADPTTLYGGNQKGYTDYPAIAN
jgi:N-ethylmaleimide reductase